MLTVRTRTKAPEGDRAPPVIGEATTRIEGENREMPGLSLTLQQAARLWGMERATCEMVWTTLVERRVLRRASNGTYIRR